MARLRGRAPRCERCRAGVPHGHWKTTTFTGAPRLSGMTAPFVYDGPMNGAVFRAHVEQVRVPTLTPGDVMIMDNTAQVQPVQRRLAGQRCAARTLCRLQHLNSRMFSPWVRKSKCLAAIAAKSERLVPSPG